MSVGAADDLPAMETVNASNKNYVPLYDFDQCYKGTPADSVNQTVTWQSNTSMMAHKDSLSTCQNLREQAISSKYYIQAKVNENEAYTRN